jgi:hypothetical protein
MTSLDELPAKCRVCAKSKVSHFHRNCHFCRDLEFQESVLCDLNRGVQDTASFQCYAFEPILKLVVPPDNRKTGSPDRPLSAEEMVHSIKQFSNSAILEKYSFAREKYFKDAAIWDEAYFVETVG